MKTENLALLALCFVTSGCMEKPVELDTSQGPVAHDAVEAWPKAPAGVPQLEPKDLLRACATAGACSPEVTQYDEPTRLVLVEMCLSDLIFSGERAIPMSEWSDRNERAEYWVACVLEHENDCGAVAQCETARNPSIYCQEDGCSASDDFVVSCNGPIAKLQGSAGTFTRDCARAFAECDPKSPTGCTDRPFTSCPDGASHQDRCEGDIRLGCDGLGQVSYHDCSRLGGTCGTAPDGSRDCIYPGNSSECGENPVPASCDGTTLSACVLGARFEIASPLCGG